MGDVLAYAESESEYQSSENRRLTNVQIRLGLPWLVKQLVLKRSNNQRTVEFGWERHLIKGLGWDVKNQFQRLFAKEPSPPSLRSANSPFLGNAVGIGASHGP
jgi:hypothetical protein